MNDIGTGPIRLIDYLPPAAVVTEYVIGAAVAFIVVQWWKAARRGGRPLNRAQMAAASALTAGAAIGLQLGVIHGYAPAKAVAYSLQGGILAPLTITVLLWCLERLAPDLRRQLSQDRRQRNVGPPETERRDDTTRWI